jgi:hypothetical protein
VAAATLQFRVNPKFFEFRLSRTTPPISLIIASVASLEQSSATMT